MRTALLAVLVCAWSGPRPALAGETSDRPGPIHRGSDAAAKALVDQPARPLPRLVWLDRQNRSSASLAGKVVVIRNFTNGCPFCVTTMPALERIHHDYRKEGVLVLGVYHPKPPRPVTADEVRGHARALGVTFPVAMDPDWSLVKSWWLDHPGTSWTSVTWVLDRQGRVRLIHPGGEYHPDGGPAHARCHSDEKELRRTLDLLLAE